MHNQRNQLLDNVTERIYNLLQNGDSEGIKNLIYPNSQSQNLAFNFHEFKSTFEKNSKGLDYESIKYFIAQ